MRKFAVTADGESLGQETPRKKASTRVVAPRARVEGAAHVVVPTSETDAKRRADAKRRSASALASVASA